MRRLGIQIPRTTVSRESILWRIFFTSYWSSSLCGFRCCCDWSTSYQTKKKEEYNTIRWKGSFCCVRWDYPHSISWIVISKLASKLAILLSFRTETKYRKKAKRRIFLLARILGKRMEDFNRCRKWRNKGASNQRGKSQLTVSAVHRRWVLRRYRVVSLRDLILQE